MATGGYRTSSGGSGSTTDFLEEWKAKREKMRAKQNPPGPAAPSGGGSDATGKPPAGALGTSAAAAANELNNNLPGGAAAPAAPGSGGVNCAVGPAALPRSVPGPRRPEDEPPPTAAAAAVSASGAPPARGDEEERDGAPEKGKSSGPSARKGKGQIEKRKLREKRRSTGVVNIPTAECLDEYEDDEAGQKERKREDAITQQNTMQNEAVSLLDPGSSYLDLIQDPSRTVSGRYKSTTASEEDVSSRYPRTDRSGFSRYNRDANASGNLVSSSMLEKKIEDLEKEVVRERQENLRLVRLMQDKEEMIGKLKEEIDLLNRDLDDIEDENEQLKQENKTLLKVVGQLTR
ncbi:PREDICTED: PRKC apoptosis WT1 regulator protein [Odobenus rosmarus divergens]|uniref:PRKC apoptosis WT1 regulator protein n=1 Tax=Odobenus rosmarus divergens TaxID=9708 RepID=A0A2U3WFE3_ODORO|nr:PREDICTED: PRKC apoptosis WT1 regulator protein [Odobenus rosmarus divergens]